MSSKSTSSIGLSASRIGEYILPSLFSSPPVTFHTSANGVSARSSHIFEATFGCIEGLAFLYYAEPFVRFLAAPGEPVTRLSVSFMRIVAGIIIGVHAPLYFGVPNRRTNVESRVALQAAFELVEVISAVIFGGLALAGSEKTGLNSARMGYLTGAVTFFAVFRHWMVFTTREWVGAYLEEDEGSKKGQ